MTDASAGVGADVESSPAGTLGGHATLSPGRMCPEARSRSCSGRATRSAIADIPVPLMEENGGSLGPRI